MMKRTGKGVAPRASQEQVRYANILNVGILVVLLSLVVTFVIYSAELLEPRVPLHKVQDYWSMPVEDYIDAVSGEVGWAWLRHLEHSDMLVFLPIALMGGLTIASCLSIVPGLLRKGDRLYAALVIIEVIVLCLAASGFLSPGAH